jgi:hypothetical protein
VPDDYDPEEPELRALLTTRIGELLRTLGLSRPTIRMPHHGLRIGAAATTVAGRGPAGGAFELLRTRRLVWVAAVVVNAAAIAARNRGFGVAVASALLSSLAVWLLGYLAVKWRRLVAVECRPSVRRVAALVHDASRPDPEEAGGEDRMEWGDARDPFLEQAAWGANSGVCRDVAAHVARTST